MIKKLCCSHESFKIGIRSQTKVYPQLKFVGSEDKKAKGAKKCLIERELKFKNYKNCYRANQLDNTIKYLGKNEINKDSLKKQSEEFIKNNKLILKKQQRFKSEDHNVYTEKN